MGVVEEWYDLFTSSKDEGQKVVGYGVKGCRL